MTWRCTSRNALTKYGACKAIVRQVRRPEGEPIEQEDFKFSPHNAYTKHCHPPVVGLKERLVIYQEVKALGLLHKYQGTTEIIYQVLANHKDLPGSWFPSVPSLRRAVNFNRQLCRPKEPSSDDVLFSIDEIYFAPGFYKGAVTTPDNSARHLIFASEKQIGYLPMANVGM